MSKVNSGGVRMGKLIDLTGITVGSLTVLSKHGRLGHDTGWLCKCECGNITIVRGADLKRSRVKSCGCNQHVPAYKHGLSYTDLYNTYYNMLQRCYNQKHPQYKDYGGRGITVCPEWKASVEVFYNWAIANGYIKGLTIDRINNNIGYSPDNCRWTTMLEQERNKGR